MNLYLVRCKIRSKKRKVRAYVIASTPTQAYEILKKYLIDKEKRKEEDLELDSIVVKGSESPRFPDTPLLIF